jgi:predicted phage-related endonuclease
MPELSARSIETRRTRIGASEVGALLALHPYTSPARIYARIVDGDTIAQTSSMGVGKALEHPALELARDTLGLKVHACSRTYVHPDLPLAATPDAYARVDWTAHPEAPALSGLPAGPGLVEIKVSGDYSLWTDLPAFVEWQVRAQLALTGRAWAFVAALVGSSLRTYLVERDAELERAMLDAVDRFDRLHLSPRIPPPTEDAELVLRWSLRTGEIVAAADPELSSLGDAYAGVIVSRRALEREEKSARAAFALELARKSGRLVIGSGWTATVDDAGSLRMAVKSRRDATG